VLGRFLSPDSVVPGMASGKGGMEATLGQDNKSALRLLIVDFHESGFAATLARENAFTQAKGFRFQLRDKDKRDGEGAKWQWGPADPQALDRYAYVLSNPLRYTDPTGHCDASGGPDLEPGDCLGGGGGGGGAGEGEGAGGRYPGAHLLSTWFTHAARGRGRVIVEQRRHDRAHWRKPVCSCPSFSATCW